MILCHIFHRRWWNRQCLESYKNSPNYIVKRLDPFAKAKDKCDKCQSYGYDYLVIERSKEG